MAKDPFSINRSALCYPLLRVFFFNVLLYNVFLRAHISMLIFRAEDGSLAPSFAPGMYVCMHAYRISRETIINAKTS